MKAMIFEPLKTDGKPGRMQVFNAWQPGRKPGWFMSKQPPHFKSIRAMHASKIAMNPVG
jgi:hypothetical protein